MSRTYRRVKDLSRLLRDEERRLKDTHYYSRYGWPREVLSMSEIKTQMDKTKLGILQGKVSTGWSTPYAFRQVLKRQVKAQNKEALYNELYKNKDPLYVPNKRDAAWHYW